MGLKFSNGRVWWLVLSVVAILAADNIQAPALQQYFACFGFVEWLNEFEFLLEYQPPLDICICMHLCMYACWHLCFLISCLFSIFLFSFALHSACMLFVVIVADGNVAVAWNFSWPSAAGVGWACEFCINQCTIYRLWRQCRRTVFGSASCSLHTHVHTCSTSTHINTI